VTSWDLCIVVKWPKKLLKWHQNIVMAGDKMANVHRESRLDVHVIQHNNMRDTEPTISAYYMCLLTNLPTVKLRLRMRYERGLLEQINTCKLNESCNNTAVNSNATLPTIKCQLTMLAKC